MRRLRILVDGRKAGILEERVPGREYVFLYAEGYDGPPVSLTMPVENRVYSFDRFPSFFEGLLPEGVMLEGLLRAHKIDKDDLLSQLAAVGADMVGAVTASEDSA